MMHANDVSLRDRLPLVRGRNTKILATLGPSSATFEKIEQLFLSGADLFRLNFSHGDHAFHKNLLTCIRAVEEKHSAVIGVLADLQGPKLRVGSFKEGGAMLKAGALFSLYKTPREGDADGVYVPHKEIFDVAAEGMRILLQDGRIQLHVREVQNNLLKCVILNDGELFSHQGLNIPDVHLPISALTDKDKNDLVFILKEGIEWIALSFVQKDTDILDVKRLIQAEQKRASACTTLGQSSQEDSNFKSFSAVSCGTAPKIVAKIEKPQAVENFEAILACADGIMIARGDLGVEMPVEEVPTMQKRLSQMCLHASKPVIVATQMLDSMTHHPTPTRAEVSDVANAIYDHVDCVMLSSESASGVYPEEAVEMMHRVIVYTENDMRRRTHNTPASFSAFLPCNAPHQQLSVEEALATATHVLSQTIPAKCIVALSRSGHIARCLAQKRSFLPLVVMTPDIKVARQLTLSWGVHVCAIEFASKNVSQCQRRENVLAYDKAKHVSQLQGAGSVLASKDKEHAFDNHQAIHQKICSALTQSQFALTDYDHLIVVFGNAFEQGSTHSLRILKGADISNFSA